MIQRSGPEFRLTRPALRALIRFVGRTRLYSHVHFCTETGQLAASTGALSVLWRWRPDPAQQMRPFRVPGCRLISADRLMGATDTLEVRRGEIQVRRGEVTGDITIAIPTYAITSAEADMLRLLCARAAQDTSDAAPRMTPRDLRALAGLPALVGARADGLVVESATGPWRLDGARGSVVAFAS